jgi:NAD dependent epimerase/dehydratase family enzyme
LLALDNAAVSGPLNLTAPQPVRMREFAQTLGKVLHRPALVPVPEMALKLLLGEGAQVPLASQRVVPRRALDLGYKFRYSELLPALVATLTP